MNDSAEFSDRHEIGHDLRLGSGLDDCHLICKGGGHGLLNSLGLEANEILGKRISFQKLIYEHARCR